MENKIIRLNQVVGLHLLNFLDGIDITNFLQVVNDDDQFFSIAPTSDQIFRQLFHMFPDFEKIFVSSEIYQHYLDECGVVNDKLVLLKRPESPFIQPYQRVYVYSCFSLEGFQKLCRAYRTPLFQCYSRLLSFNTDFYPADFGLINYELYCSTIDLNRELNEHEEKILKVNAYFSTYQSEQLRSTIQFVRTVNDFRENLKIRFLSHLWLEAIDFEKFIIVGGCVINALCQLPFPDTQNQDINIVNISESSQDCEKAIEDAIQKLQMISAKYSKDYVKVEKIPGSWHYDIFLPCGVRLNFTHVCAKRSANTISRIVYNFDMDLCQVVFTGDKIISTFAFIQAFSTKSFIVYSLHGEARKDVIARIAKYSARGFRLLMPTNFDGNFDFLLSQDEVPLYQMMQQENVDHDGETHIITKESWRRPARNVDTYQVQEDFIIDTLVEPSD